MVQSTTLKDVYIIKPEINHDWRGEYVMTYNEREFNAHFPDFHPVEHDISTSIKNVFRGIHYSPHCWKLNQCLYGSMIYYVVNCDEEDEEFGKWESFPLNDRNRWQIYKHPRYGSGFLVLSDYAIFHYLQDQYFNNSNPDQRTFNMEDFNLYIPVDNYLLSERDAFVKEYAGDKRKD